jgi:hypothetical protein
MCRERSQSDQAIVSTVHRFFGTDLVLGVAAEEQQELYWESCKIEAR